MPHLNELKKKYGDKGLSILAVTSAPAGETEKWIKDNKAAYGYAYDPSNELGTAWNITSIPHAVLVTPDGLVAWRGNPSGLTDLLIEKAIEVALPKPVWEWPKEAAKVRKFLEKGQYAKAIEAARKEALDNQNEELDAIANALQSLVQGKVAAVREMRDKGDFLGAYELGEKLAKDLKGLPEQEAVETIVGEIKKDKEAKNVMRAQKRLAKVEEGVAKARRKKHYERLISSAKAAVKGLEGTYANAQAERLIAKLEKAAESAP